MNNLSLLLGTGLLSLSVSSSGYVFAKDNAVNTIQDTLEVAIEPIGQSPLSALQHEWAHINYELEPEQKEPAFIALIEKARSFVNDDPDNPALIIWQGIIESSTAGAKGGLGALDYAKAARKSFEHAMQIDQNALSGSALTSLGVLYHKLPGWPISFGSDKKAERLLKQALQINPEGIDPNYFYAEFLYDNGNYSQAMEYIRRAKQAPVRPSRPVADLGRHQEIALLEERIAHKL